ncbi:MAG: nucleotidyltransferase domain-containing protein [Nanoarchaeota archaeon]|nr:nucleotidyltransferase domain-containing protein [Nanoarchaeota archaeon]
MERNKLISLAMNFSSFLVGQVEVKSIILFGSVAKNNFDEESDIDIFVECDKGKEKNVGQMLDLYKKTEEYEKFRLEGIENELSIKSGRLDNWKDLKRSIISSGIVLYGSYHGTPDKLNHKLLFLLNLEGIFRADKIRVWRSLYGYRQKVGKKVYISKGKVEKKLGRGAFLVPIQDSQEVINYLKKNKIKYSLLDVWTE